MNLYIQVENGVSINHPALEENLIHAFGSVPDNWEPFLRIERPMLQEYEVLESEEPTYEKIDGVWTDVWHIRDMTEEERSQRDEEIALMNSLAEQSLQNNT